MTKLRLRRMIAVAVLTLCPAFIGLHTQSAHGAAAQSKPWSQEGADEGRSQWLRGETRLTIANAEKLQPQYAFARFADWGECNYSEAFAVPPVTTPSTLVYEASDLRK